MDTVGEGGGEKEAGGGEGRKRASEPGDGFESEKEEDGRR